MKKLQKIEKINIIMINNAYINIASIKMPQQLNHRYIYQAEPYNAFMTAMLSHTEHHVVFSKRELVQEILLYLCPILPSGCNLRK